ncbi:MAG: tetratricopeptide repeat protein [Candidatus Yanofskybacteria bacterium]|nr:tetratricopeptide repeat protein [Candidatus Yanofskybacteria bacterium]
MWNLFRKKGKVFGKYEYINFKEPALVAEEPKVVPVSDGENIWTSDGGTPNQTEQSSDGTGQASDVGDVGGGEISTEFEKKLVLPRKIVRGLLLALTFLVPLFFLPFTAPGDVLVFNKQILIFSLSLVGLVAWLAIVVQEGGLVSRKSGLEWGVLAVVAASLVSAILSFQVYWSFTSGLGFLTIFALALFFFLTLNFFEKKDIGKIINVFITSVSLAVLASLLNLFGLPVFKLVSQISYKDLLVDSRFNTVGSASELGMLAVFALVLLIGSCFRLDSSDSKFKGLKLVAGLILALFLIVLNLWSLFVVLAVGMFGVVLALGLAQKNNPSSVLSGGGGQKIKLKTSQLVVPLVILVLSGVFALSSRYFDFGLSGGLLKEKLPIETSLSQRGSLDIAVNAFKMKPAFGFGPGNYSLVYDQFKPDSINNTSFWSSRFSNSVSEFFDFLAEGGAVAVAALMILLFLIARAIWRHSSEVFPAFVTVLALFFLFPFNLPMLFGFWLLVSLTAVSAGAGRQETKIKMDDASFSSIAISLAFVLVLVSGLVGAYLLAQKYRGELYFAQAARMSGADRAEIDSMILLVGKAVSADKNNSSYLNSLANLLLRRVSLDIKDKEDKPEEVKKRIEDNTRTIIQTANQMTVVQKNNSASWFNAGLVYENLIGFVGGADEAALTAYREYLKKSPKDPNGYVRIGNIYLLRADNTGAALREAKSKGQEVKNEEEIKTAVTKDYKNAEDSYKKAIELKADLATALYNLGTVYEREAKLKEAVKQLELTKLLNQSNPGLAFELGLLYYRDNQKDKALAEMTRAVSLFKDYSNARWYLALMLEEKGELDSAIAQLQEILKLDANKDNPVVLEKIAALEKGKREFPPGKITSKKPL